MNDLLLSGIRDLKKRLETLEALAETEAAASGRTFSTTEVALLLGLSSEAMTAWARRAAVGSIRDGFQLVGREGRGPRPQWRWRAVS